MLGGIARGNLGTNPKEIIKNISGELLEKNNLEFKLQSLERF